MCTCYNASFGYTMCQSEEAGSCRVHIRKYKVFDVLSLEIGLVFTVKCTLLFLVFDDVMQCRRYHTFLCYYLRIQESLCRGQQWKFKIFIWRGDWTLLFIFIQQILAKEFFFSILVFHFFQNTWSHVFLIFWHPYSWKCLLLALCFQKLVFSL